MAETSKIEWTDSTWNPITGCSVVSPGCAHCYAMRLAGGRLAHHPSRAGLTVDSKAGPVWTGEVRLNEAWLDQPLRWRKPRRIFVCAHGDLFHEAVPDEWIDRVFAVMALAPHHTFQVLTKRSARMRAYASDESALGDRLCRAAWVLRNGDPGEAPDWPLPNVWLGVSAEDQRRADERIPDLLETPAAVRFVSAEPLLGPVSLTDIVDGREVIKPLAGLTWYPTPANFAHQGMTARRSAKIDWVIAGGESGPDWRYCPDAAFYSLRDQCAAAGVPFFEKQMPGKRPIPADLHIREWPHA